MRKSEQLPAAEPEHLDGGLGPLGGGSQQGGHGGSFGGGGPPRPLEEERGGGEEWPLGGGALGAGGRGLQDAGLVLEVVGVDELVEQRDGGALGLRVLHPEVPQVGPGVAGQPLPGLEPSTTQVADDVLAGVSLQGCRGGERRRQCSRKGGERH